MATTASQSGTEKKKANGFNARLLWQTIRRHPIAIFFLVLLAGGSAALVWFYLPLPKMTGVAMFHVSSTSNNVMYNVDNKVDFRTYAAQQAAVIKQRLTIMEVLKNEDVAKLPIIREKNDPAVWLENELKVDFKGGPEFMRVTMEGNEKDDLLKILTALSSAYMSKLDDRENGVRKKQIEELARRQSKCQDDLTRFHRNLQGITTVLKSPNPAVLAVMDKLTQDNLDALRRDISRNREELTNAKIELEGAREKALPEKMPPVPEIVIERQIATDARYMQKQRDIAVLQYQHDILKGQLTDPKHPRLVKLASELKDAEKSMLELKLSIRPKIEEELKNQYRQVQEAKALSQEERLKNLQKISKSLNDQIELIKNELGSNTQLMLSLERTRSDIQRHEKMYSEISEKLDHLQMEQASPLRVSEYDKPYVATGIEGNRRMKFSAMASGGILALGLVLLVFWEFRTQRVSHVDDVSTNLGMRIVGTVPPIFAANTEHEAIHEAALTEAVDTARTVMLYGTNSNKPLRTVLVTSAEPGEGKTTLSGHLAVSLTRAGYKTLLIDGDLRNPSTHKIFGHDLNAPGLCEVLRGDMDKSEAIIQSPIPGLSILPAGNWNLFSTQALGGSRWSSLRMALEAEYDYIVIDSAPVLPVVDTLLLARQVDGVLISVMQDMSRVSTIAASQNRLLSIGANILGVVVNNVESTLVPYYYAYRTAKTDAVVLQPNPSTV